MIPPSRFKSRQSKRFVERKNTRLILIASLMVICLVTFGFSLIRIVNLNLFEIQYVTVSGADGDISPSLQAAALDAVSGDYWGIFSKASTFFYPAKAVKDSVTKASPRIASVSVKRQGLQALVISVEEKAPAALVCANLPDFTGNSLSFGDSDSCYFADDTGYIYGAAPSFSGNVYNRYYVPDLTDGTSSLIVGQMATSTTEFHALQTLFADLKNTSIAAEAVLIKAAGEYELYVRNPSQSNLASSSDSDMAVIYFDDSRSFSEQLSNLVSFWKNMTETAAAKHLSLSFDYIDVRYGTNVFYRLNK